MLRNASEPMSKPMQPQEGELYVTLSLLSPLS